MTCVLPSTLRMRLSPESAMKRSSAASTAIPVGLFNCANVAGPPSPQAGGAAQATPVPATVEILKAVSTRRIRLSPVSAMKRLPLLSTATPLGVFKLAEFAGPPSPQTPVEGLHVENPTPAYVVITPP